MKTEINTVVPFGPITISIMFETKDELDLFASLCNYTPVTDSLTMPDYTIFQSIGANTYLTDKLEELLLKSPRFSHLAKQRTLPTE